MAPVQRRAAVEWVRERHALSEWHDLRRLRLRSLLNANIQDLLLAAGQNLKRILAASGWGWGRRPFPNGSAGVVLPALSSCKP